MREIIITAFLLALLAISVQINFIQSGTVREQDKLLSRTDSLTERADSLIRGANNEAEFWYKMYRKKKSRN